MDIIKELNNYHNSNFICNIRIEQRQFYEEAIATHEKLYNDYNYFIKKEAYWRDGFEDITMNSLYSKDKERKNNSNFWKIVHDIGKDRINKEGIYV